METDNDELTAEIKAQVEEWSSNSNESFTLDILRGDGTKAASFPPEFTYPIFGEEEAIFGYQDLAINLTFAAHNLKPHLRVSYSQKFKAQGEVRPTDIHEALTDFLPPVAFSREGVEDALRDEHAAEFSPPGERIHGYSRGGKKYEIWCASLADSAAKQLLENMQVLVPMFIEGGSMLQLEQDWTTQRWKLFLLYEVDSQSPRHPTHSPYTLIGYATSYRIFTFPDRQTPLQSDLDMFIPTTQSLLDFLPPPSTAIPNDFAPTAMPDNITTPLDLPSRERLSQFLILPPYQSAGHGQELYNTLYTTLTKPTNIREFTVEDPNEAFDDLRDMCDLLYLRAHNPSFASLRINTTIPPESLHSTSPIPTTSIIPSSSVREKIRAETKIMPRQLDRLIEMHTLSFIPPLHRSRNRITRKEKTSGEMDRAYYFWRLYVKQRLFVFNRDMLVQVEGSERVEKLESALDSVLEGYGKCIERVERREKEGGGGAGVNGERAVIEGRSEGDDGSAVRKARLGKRKVVAEEEDDEEEEEGDGGGEDGGEERVVAVNGHKKVRVE